MERTKAEPNIPDDEVHERNLNRVLRHIDACVASRRAVNLSNEDAMALVRELVPEWKRSEWVPTAPSRRQALDSGLIGTRAAPVRNPYGPTDAMPDLQLVLRVMSQRLQTGVSVGLSRNAALVLAAAVRRESPAVAAAEWNRRVMPPGRSGVCFSCRTPILAVATIAQWPLNRRWGHDECVQDLAARQPPTYQAGTQTEPQAEPQAGA